MKGKATMVVTICAVVALLVAVILMQFRTVEETDISALEAMRETELRAEVATWKTKYEEAMKQLSETEEKIQEYYSTMESNEAAAELLETELKEAQMKLGKIGVTGSGVSITLEDNEIAKIEAYDIYKLINELRLAGAEAISVNDIRVTAMTDIKDIAPGWIVIDGNKMYSKYVINAIGEQTYLESALNVKTYGYMDYVIKNYDKTGWIDRVDKIEIPATKKAMEFQYAQEVKEQ